MRYMKIGKSNHAKCASFANSNRNERIGGLQLSKRINVRLKCDCLEDVDALGAANYEEKEQVVAAGIMSTSNNRILLFPGIEQGSGKNSKHVCASQRSDGSRS